MKRPCLVVIRGKDGPHAEQITAEGVFDAVNQIVQGKQGPDAAARQWWYDSEGIADVYCDQRRWTVRLSRVSEWARARLHGPTSWYIGLKAMPLPLLPHCDIEPDCCGCLIETIDNDGTRFVCNECGAVVSKEDVARLVLQMESCATRCQHCGKMNHIDGFSEVFAFTCWFCGKASIS
jgi:hypothetical protein